MKPIYKIELTKLIRQNVPEVLSAETLVESIVQTIDDVQEFIDKKNDKKA